MSGLTITPAELARLGKRVVNGVAVPIEWVEHQPTGACAIVGKHADCRLGSQSPLRSAQQQATAEAIGPRYKSKGEAMYGGRLYVLQRAGAISEWRYEAITLRLGDRVRFTIDFYLRFRDGSVELHEVKGVQAWEDARVKLHVAAAMYPEFRFFLIRVRRGQVESTTRILPLTQADV